MLSFVDQQESKMSIIESKFTTKCEANNLLSLTLDSRRRNWCLSNKQRNIAQWSLPLVLYAESLFEAGT
jgi:hypothetical protein